MWYWIVVAISQASVLLVVGMVRVSEVCLSLRCRGMIAACTSTDRKAECFDITGSTSVAHNCVFYVAHIHDAHN